VAGLAVALALVTLLVMGRVAGQDFVLWDDNINIYRNPLLNPPSWEHLGRLWAGQGFFQYVPVTETAWSVLAVLGHLDAPIAGLASGALLDPHVFHTANLVFHVVNVLLVLWILRGLVVHDLAAATGALLFAIHPLQVESVAWASELRGVLAASFGLLALALYLRVAREGGRVLYGLCLVLMAAAMLSKPSAASIPLVMIVIDLLVLRRPWRQVARMAGPILLLTLPLLLLPAGTQPLDRPFSPHPWERPLIAGDTLAFYLYKLAVPVNLAIDYGRSPARVLGSWWGWVTWTVPAAVAAIIWLLRRRAPWLVPAGLIGLAGVLPVLGLVTFAFQYYSTAADRYVYLAMLGPALAVAFAVATLSGPYRAAAPAVATALLVVLAGLSFWQVGFWDDTRSLMAHAAAVNPNSDLAFNNLGIVDAQQGRLRLARTELETSIRLNSRQYQAHSNLGNVRLLSGDTAGAIAEYRASIAIRADWDESHGNLGTALYQQRKYVEAEAEYRLALRLNPDSRNAAAGLQRTRLAIELGS